MSLRHLIDGLPRDWKPRSFDFPLACETEEARIEVENKLGVLSGPPLNIDMPDLRERMTEAAALGDWSGINERDWRYASECLSFGTAPLIDNARFMDAYLSHALAGQGTAIINGLTRYYLWHFDPKTAGFARIGYFLAEIAAAQGSRWAELHRVYRLFDPSNAPAMLAQAVMAAELPPRDFLAHIGFSGVLSAARLLGEAFVQACDSIVEMAATGQPASHGVALRLVSWSMKGKEFLYGGVSRARPALAEALLLPWATTSPPAETREFIKRVLLGLLKEPRTNPVAWADVSEQAQCLMCHWLAKVSLEQFLAVVDETVQLHHSRMWSSRRKFWNAFHEKGYMQEAWVVFGRRGAAIARHAAGTRERHDIVSFGTFTGETTSDQRQAVLIMKIGSVVVADWSHNGCCHVWLPGNTSAPKLFQREYYRSDLTIGSDFEKPHVGLWQADIHEFIRANTGFWMPSGDYL
ncbi:MAG: EH signature domain-containing protein [Rhodospirillaceae bacterium]